MWQFADKRNKHFVHEHWAEYFRYSDRNNFSIEPVFGMSILDIKWGYQKQ